MTEEKLLTTGEVARLLGCSRQHVVDLCSKGMLPYVSVGTHRRILRADALRLAGGTLRREQERSLWLHRAVAGRLAMDTARVLAMARDNMQNLRDAHPEGRSAHCLERWDAVLKSGPDAVFDVLTSTAEWAVELRRNSPFAGVLEPDERAAVLDSFRQHWRTAHAA